MEPIIQFVRSETDLFFPTLVWVIILIIGPLIVIAIASEIVFQYAIRHGKSGSRIKVLRAIINEKDLESGVVGVVFLLLLTFITTCLMGGVSNSEAQEDDQPSLKLEIAKTLSEKGYSLTTYEDNPIERTAEIMVQRVSDDRSGFCVVTREAGSREWDSVTVTYSIDCIV